MVNHLRKSRRIIFTLMKRLIFSHFLFSFVSHSRGTVCNSLYDIQWYIWQNILVPICSIIVFLFLRQLIQPYTIYIYIYVFVCLVIIRHMPKYKACTFSKVLKQSFSECFLSFCFITAKKFCQTFLLLGCFSCIGHYQGQPETFLVINVNLN